MTERTRQLCRTDCHQLVIDYWPQSISWKSCFQSDSHDATSFRATSRSCMYVQWLETGKFFWAAILRCAEFCREHFNILTPFCARYQRATDAVRLLASCSVHRKVPRNSAMPIRPLGPSASALAEFVSGRNDEFRTNRFCWSAFCRLRVESLTWLLPGALFLTGLWRSSKALLCFYRVFPSTSLSVAERTLIADSAVLEAKLNRCSPF